MITRTYETCRDAVWLHGLWHRTLAPQWAILHDDLQQRLHAATIKVVLEIDGQPIAFCAAPHQPSSSAGLLFLAVEPTHQRKGFGSTLLQQVQEVLAAAGCSSCSLGNGGMGDYFWPGVPEADSSAWPFFIKHGWTESDRACDLVQALAAYRTPSWVSQRVLRHGVAVELATPDLRARISDFERRSFPEWLVFFDNAMNMKSFDNVLIARDPGGAVIGSLLLNCGDFLTWQQALGGTCGSLGVLGVREDQRGKGIGLALAARAMELLQTRGCLKCYIHWTGLTSWYGKLGATVWADYHMSSRTI